MSYSKSFDFSALPAGTDVTEPATGLYWLNKPRASAIEPGKGLRVTPTPGSDYWRKTYAHPPADRATGNALVVKVPVSVNKWCVSTDFSMSLIDQYDQSGLMVYVDDHHWLKTGIEYEGGVANMSCVVTNGQSDWNYFPWSSAEGVEIRAQLERCGGVLACTVSNDVSVYCGLHLACP